MGLRAKDVQLCLAVSSALESVRVQYATQSTCSSLSPHQLSAHALTDTICLAQAVWTAQRAALLVHPPQYAQAAMSLEDSRQVELSVGV
mgnify:CR=1 FL=1